MDFLDLQKLRDEIQPGTKKESVAKAKEGAKEEIQRESSNDSATTNEVASRSEEITEKWNNLLALENLVAEKISSLSQFNYEIVRNPKLDNESLGDILLRSFLKNRRDKIIEVKLFQTKITFNAIQEAIKRLKFVSRLYTSKIQRLPLRYLFIVYEDKIATSEEINKLNDTLNSYRKENNLSTIGTRIYSAEQLRNEDFSYLAK